MVKTRKPSTKNTTREYSRIKSFHYQSALQKQDK